jgi:transcriptional regulator GlxA family with amidase domain
MQVAILLFPDFETLDVFGPVEILGRLKEHFQIVFYSLEGGKIPSAHGFSIETQPLSGSPDVFLIPGGYGTRVEVNNSRLIDAIREIAERSRYVLTVCTGTALLARTGLLDGRKATSNKRAFDWVCSTGDKVHWIRQARWIVDGKFYTSSGVSAGMDMTLGFLSDLHGLEFARDVAAQIEFNWQEDHEKDDFAIQRP